MIAQEGIQALAGKIDAFAHAQNASTWENARRCRRHIGKAMEARTLSAQQFGLQLALVEYRRFKRQIARIRKDQARRKARA